jgi:CDP-Glycerol:Poly(glycerophosphate) glycerophosphotransferase
MPDGVWLALPDQLSTRLFFDSGIVDRLAARLGDRLTLVLLLPDEEAAAWRARAPDVRALADAELRPTRESPAAQLAHRLDQLLDRHAGYYPLAIRLNYRHGFHLQRMARGHGNWMLDLDRAGRLPRGQRIDRALERWYFSPRRYVPRPLLERMRLECGALVLSNVQPRKAVPYLTAARRLGVPVVAHVASWDHTVGKGVISPHCEMYVVQNRGMEDDLVRYHDIPSERIVVSGWPQTDIYFRQRPRNAYDELLRSFGLDPERPLVVVMGNTPTNMPYEGRFVERILVWWESQARGRFSLLFRPHPRDREWRERFGSALGRTDVHVQEPSFRDFEQLATLLQHCDCVVTNAGTILLEALVNDRPAVCVLYDEGGPPGESWALKNVIGEHYRELAESGAFYKAERFEEVVEGVWRALANPSELADERRRIAREVVGEVDGRAADRVVDAIVGAVR